ncbi:hypothetical protein DFH11DRAFT_1637358 [Phellopilus nigrolimitatus]|nr:hypothetical protein DFH11DRAFT_1637358 [Phellopilus nigrolimitatus]
MAPFVEDADITHGNLVDMEDLACLHTWSKTLTRLTLYIVQGDSGEIRYFPPLRKLRYFYCEAPVVHPRCFESMDSLEELVYCMLPEQAKQLVNCFREGAGSGDFLPALKVVRFRPYLRRDDYVESWRVVLKSLEEICTRRRISFSAEGNEEYH